MLNYEDPYKLHISEMPCNLDEQTHIIKKYADTLIKCEPVQIIRNGDWSGTWRVTRVSTLYSVLGYVRFDLDDLFAYMRPGVWDNEEMVARFDISAAGGFVTGLRNACETLLLYRMTQMSELSY
jgi:hypothetical protein